MSAKVEIEVCAYEDACWAPVVDGVQFKWAWCVISKTGQRNHIKGACNGSKAHATRIARATAKKMAGETHLNRVRYGSRL